MTWYRIHFRQPSSSAHRPPVLVDNEMERDRIMARRAPKAVTWEIARIWTCSVCETEGPWTDQWSWFGSYKQIDDGEPVKAFCSPTCRKKTHASPDQRMVHRHEEKDNWSEIYKAVRADRVDSRRTRTFPMPIYPKEQTGRGWCRWCGGEILHTEGKRIGQRHRQRLWHPECKSIWLLRIDLHVQRQFLSDRDGNKCAVCGEIRGSWKKPSWARPRYYWMGAGDESWLDRDDNRMILEDDDIRGLYTAIIWHDADPLEVDHVIPLWTVAHLPDADRREYFGPDNLWLLCDRHHKEKSKWEAADRAAHRREAAR